MGLGEIETSGYAAYSRNASRELALFREKRRKVSTSYTEERIGANARAT